MSDDFPQSQADGVVVLAAPLWNKVARLLQWLERFDVAPPLALDDTNGGGFLKLLGGNNSLFPVLVEKTGGTNGNKTTVANYTYKVADLSGNTLDTAVALSRPRPKGTAVFQAGTIADDTAGYGTAFYDTDGTLILWDAGEIYGQGGCA